MKIWIKGALTLSVFGVVLAGCNGSDDDGGPSAGATATPSGTANGTASATGTANGTPSATGTASGTPSATATSVAAPFVTAVALVSQNGGQGGSSSLRLNVFAATQPRRILRNVLLTGLPARTNLVGIDYRPATRQLYALGITRASVDESPVDAQLYTINTSTGAVAAVGSPFDQPVLSGSSFGFDFNPVPDRIRVVSNTTVNFRLNPITGAPVDSNASVAGLQRDPNVLYDAGDRNVGRRPQLVGAAYTNSVRGATSTTNYAIDAATGSLVTQGSLAGTTPAVSPNTGRLFTVGSLGVPLGNSSSSNFVSFDIGRDPRSGGSGSDAALAAINNTLYSINLSTGAATRIDQIGNGSIVRGLAIVP